LCFIFDIFLLFLPFQVDPSGSSFGWKATAIGKNYINANNFLERRYNEVSLCFFF
jgi:20S proteasome alpha/beta subunit